MSELTNQPPKGTYDWTPEDFALRKYIFDTWRAVCQRFGYQEYLTPLVEYADLYRAKSGEDVGGSELTVFEDRGGRQLAIRPEMTPSVTRMVSKIYNESPKPLRLFSIANFYRNEKPQRGRNREFWQLNFDIFGSQSALSDLEILQMALEIMLAFNPPAGSFKLRLNNRKLINSVLPQITNQTALIRLLDKYEKLAPLEFQTKLSEFNLTSQQINKLTDFLNSNVLPDQETQYLLDELNKLGLGDWVEFYPNLMRGFDYYDGMIFEVFDNKPENSRAMFGGGRYNGLAQIFGSESFPAVGCAPGDETTKLFLESWNLVPELKIVPTQILVTSFSEELISQSLKLSLNLRQAGINTEIFPDANIKLDKQLKYAAQKNIPYVAILGPEEVEKDIVTLKNMLTGEQKQITLNECLQELNPTFSS
jgi:histidyl-tRNA synthetase